jgi:hypothetical protein
MNKMLSKMLNKIQFTFGSINFLKSGRKKYKIPLADPSSVQALISKMKIITYGNNAKKYENLPELLTPRTITIKIQIHANKSHNVSSKSGVPIPSSI